MFSAGSRVKGLLSPFFVRLQLTATLRLSHRTSSLLRMQDISHTCMDLAHITRDVSESTSAYRARLLCPGE
ncbi:hypothetical protein BDW42DRAFT_173936 [Aspergillus taichungensis]|uniref:Uncharacterized protein n=1 Tax=Aspergillus taichungensis TaxID=482145 RepID=A0A2J5HP13_9EURO|nr:hypothetical protein BDW42DRAFT_173936 [Aspergillus taichungensis]